MPHLQQLGAPLWPLLGLGLGGSTDHAEHEPNAPSLPPKPVAVAVALLVVAAARHATWVATPWRARLPTAANTAAIAASSHRSSGGGGGGGGLRLGPPMPPISAAIPLAAVTRTISSGGQSDSSLQRARQDEILRQVDDLDNEDVLNWLNLDSAGMPHFMP